MKRSVAVLVTVALFYAPAAAGWTWPVEGPVLRPFALGNDPYAAGQHRGIDIGAEAGTTVRAATSGTVTFAGAVPVGGRTVTVRTPNGLSVTHLELGAISVVRGAEVAEGDELGTIGPAEHVHLGVRLAADPHGYLDPLQFLPARTNLPGRAETDGAAAVQPQLRATEPGSVDVTAVGERDTKPEPAVAAQTPGPAGEPRAAPAAAQATGPAGRSPEVETPSPSTPEPKAREPAPAQLGVEQAGATTVAEGVETARGSPDRSVRGRAKEIDTASHAPRSVTGRRPPRRVDSHSPTAVVRDRHRAEVARPQAATPAVPAALRADYSLEPERPASASQAEGGGTDPVTWKVASAALALLGVAVLAGAAAGHRGRRRPDARRVLRSVPTTTCSRRPARPRRLIHPCVRAVQPGWALPAPRACAVPNRPSPRRRRRPAAAVAA